MGTQIPTSTRAPGQSGHWILGGRCQDRTELLITWRVSKMRKVVLARLNSQNRSWGSGSQKAKQLRWTPQSHRHEGPHAWPASTLVTWPTGNEAGCETAAVAAGKRLARCVPVHRTIPGAQESVFTVRTIGVGSKAAHLLPIQRVREPNSSPGSEQ